jgi:hypothetical protein
MLRFLVILGLLVSAGLWLPLAMKSLPNTADMHCPPNSVMIRYPKEMADYHDGPKGMEHYRLAYCKPTGIDWRKQ